MPLLGAEMNGMELLLCAFSTRKGVNLINKMNREPRIREKYHPKYLLEKYKMKTQIWKKCWWHGENK